MKSVVANNDGIVPRVRTKLSPALIRQASRFCVVGIINTAVDLLILNLLILVTGTGHSGALFTFFKTVSFLVAVINSYVMNAKWTFADPAARTTTLQGAQFIFVSILGSVLNIGSASYVATYVSPPIELHGYWPSVAALVGTICSFVFNFAGYKFFVFAGRTSAGLQPAAEENPRSR